MRRLAGSLLACLLAVTLVAPMMGLAAQAKETLVIWSHWADELNKKGFVNRAVQAFLAENPDYDVQVVWYQKADLNTALSAALQAGRGPDIFYLESSLKGEPPYAESGYLVDLEDYIDYDALVEPWAKAFAVSGDITYLWPLEAYAPFMYYNKEAFAKAGVQVPASGRFTTDEFIEACRKLAAAGYIPMSAGTMDRDWAAAIFPEVMLLKALGPERWRELSSGKLSWEDPDVVKTLQFVEELVRLGAFPRGVAAIKLGESHGVFFRGDAAMFPMKSFFAGRAFVPEEAGGMPESLQLGIMDFPIFAGGKYNDYSYMEAGGSYGVSVFSKHPDKAAELLAHMADPDVLSYWVGEVKVQTGLRSGAAHVDHWYIDLIAEAQKGLEYVAGPFSLGMNASYRDAFFQSCEALLAGQMTAKQMIQQMEMARRMIR